MREGTFRLGAVVMCALLGACVPSLHHEPPREADLHLPTAYPDPARPGDASLAASTWQALFDDPDLVALIDEALAHNQELALLEQEIAIGEAEVGARRGEVLPEIGLTAGAGLEKVGEYTSQGASDAVHDIEPGREVPETLGDLKVGLEASWEIDIWKKLRNATKAARYRYLASIEGRSFAVTNLVAEVADTWYELLALDNQLAVLQDNVRLLQDSLEIVKLQKEAARTTELGVQRFEAELLATQSREYEVRQRIVETENRLNLLCGRYPQPIRRSAAGFVDLAPLPVTTGVPTALLENRPDIRAAELQLEAAKLDVKSARAAFYPSIRIDAEAGYEAFATHALFTTPESLFYAASAGLLAPLINRAGLTADYRAANARQMQAVIGYERTVLSAYVEAANQISKIENVGHMVDAKAQQVQRLQDAIETSTGLYTSARADWLEVLTTRRDALESRMELLETKRDQMSAMVDAYRALGGGWTRPTTTP